MRSVGRSWSGGDAGGACARGRMRPATAGEWDWRAGGVSAATVCEPASNAARESGVVTFGKEANGQPSYRAAPCISVSSADDLASE